MSESVISATADVGTRADRMYCMVQEAIIEMGAADMDSGMILKHLENDAVEVTASDPSIIVRFTHLSTCYHR